MSNEQLSASERANAGVNEGAGISENVSASEIENANGNASSSVSASAKANTGASEIASITRRFIAPEDVFGYVWSSEPAPRPVQTGQAELLEQMDLAMKEQAIADLSTQHMVDDSDAGSLALDEIAYVHRTLDKEQDSYSTHIRLISRSNGEDRALTAGTKDTQPAWSPDGSKLAFLRVVAGKPQIFVQAYGGATDSAAAVTAAPMGVSSYAWSPDGLRLAYISKAPVSGANVGKESASEKSVIEESVSEEIVSEESVSIERKSSVERQLPAPTGGISSYERTIPKAEGSGWWDGLYAQLFVIELASGKAERLTEGCYQVSHPVWTPDGQSIGFLAKKPLLDGDTDRVVFQDIYLVRSLNGTKGQTRITEGGLVIDSFVFTPDGSRILLLGGTRQFGSSTHTRLYAADVATGALSPISPEDLQLGCSVIQDMTVGGAAAGPLYCASTERVYALGTSEGRVGVYAFDVAPSAPATAAASSAVQQQLPQPIPAPLVGGNRCIYQLSLTPDGSALVFAAIDKAAPGELYALAIRSGVETRLTSWNQPLVQALAVSEPQELWCEAPDGTRLQGWLMKPPAAAAAAPAATAAPTASPAGKLPLVLVIHGGPHAMYTPFYSHELQTLCAAGYAVLFANPRGSFGYGQAFATACRGDFGGVDYQDLLTVLDAALAANPDLDKERLGVMGGSYGGLMTNWMIGQSDRFRAAVSQRGISNWLSFYGSSDIGISYTEGIAGAHPWEDAKLLWERSPIAYADKVEAPVLIMHGEQDFRCPIEQSDSWYTALKRHGKTARLVRYAGGNHTFLKLGKPSYRVDAARQVNEWFKQYL